MTTGAPDARIVQRTAPAEAAEALFAGPGEMRARCRAVDWAQTDLGPVAQWPACLRTVVQSVLASPFPSIVLWGPDLIQLYNDGYRALMGVKHPAGLAQPTRECWPEVWHLNAPIYARVWAGESVALEDALYPITRSGVLEDAWFTLSYSPVRDDAAVVAGVLVSVFETTARHEVERLLAESEAARAALLARDLERERLMSALESSADLIGLAAEDGTGLYLNATGRRLTGVAETAVIGDIHVRDFFFPEDRPFVEGTLLATVVREGRWRDELRLRHMTTGAAIPVLYDMFRVTDPASGTLIGYGTVARDLTERDALLREARAARAEAEQARRAAETANRAKSQFLAVMSHELRTPLNAIGGYAQLMEMGIRGPITTEQREDLARLQRSQRHLLGLVNEVLNYAKLETRTVRYEFADVVVDTALAEAEGLVAPQARARGLVLAVTDCAGVLAVRADPEKLRQVLVNLLSNAVKFTEPGGSVAVACAARGACVEIAVRDTGIGIPVEKLEAIFEPFVQVRSDLTRRHEGTGLGLAISRDLARGMGGDLTVASVLGEGSTFTLTLPRA